MRYTIKDVANRVQVSIATVSRVLNGQGGYSKNTEAKVLNAIQEMGYQPNAMARSLINNRSNTIAILFPEVSSQFSAKILAGAEEAIHSFGSSVIVCNTSSRGQRTMKYLQLLAEKRVEGIIFVSETMTKEYFSKLNSMKIPVVLAATESYQYPFPFVKVNDQHAAYSAAAYLISKGHKRIGMISGNREDVIAGLPRVAGFKQAMMNHGISPNEDEIMYAAGFSFKDGVQSLSKLLEKVPDITAVFAASDEMALGAISAAHKMGLIIPDDLSIIGYDNLPIAEMCLPPLTTVEQPLVKIGKIAAEMLFTMMETEHTAESRIVPHKIIERETVRTIG